MQVCFNCPVLQGYGMTENCAAAVVMPLGYDKGGNVGGSAPSTVPSVAPHPCMLHCWSLRRVRVARSLLQTLLAPVGERSCERAAQQLAAVRGPGRGVTQARVSLRATV